MVRCCISPCVGVTLVTMNPMRLSLALLLASAVTLSCNAQRGAGGGAPGASPSDGGPRLNFSGLGDSTPKPLPPQRVITGVVRDKNGAPAKGALVYLKDEKTADIKSMTADVNGGFRFVQLSRTVDYKVWAQTKDSKSPEKAITSFETKDEITRDLKADQPLAAKPLPAAK
jgi:hypothetical protein